MAEIVNEIGQEEEEEKVVSGENKAAAELMRAAQVTGRPTVVLLRSF